MIDDVRSHVSAAWIGSADDVLDRLGTSSRGLDEREAARRRRTGGPNELVDANPPRPLALLFAQFRSVFIVILLAAAVISGFTGDWADCAAIGAILIANAGIGFFQEYGAEKALAALRRLTGRTAKVRRIRATRVIPAAELVVGDIVLLEPGDVVPADARLLESSACSTVEAALTGESTPVEKDARARFEEHDVSLADRSNMVWFGTSIAAGTATAVVTAIGMNTEVGKIAGMVERAGEGEITPLRRRLTRLGRQLAAVALAIVGVLFVIGSLRGDSLLELALASVSLAVAAVPEGLPAVVTIALAVGVRRMARRRALIRRLHAVETLGAATIVCSDKTGTLTIGEMTVKELIAGGRIHDVEGGGYAPEGAIRARDGGAPEVDALLLAFAGCSSAVLSRDEDGVYRVVGDPTEGALLAAAGKAGVDAAQIERDWPKLGEIPFDSDRKRMTIVRLERGASRAKAWMKGAPDVVLARCVAIREGGCVRALDERDRDSIERELSALADRAMRVLAVAEREFSPPPSRLDAESIESEFTWLGIAAMVDPPRPEAKAAVAKCRSAGIRVAMITGDHPRTAVAIAREIGIASAESQALTGTEIDRLDDASFARVLAQTPRVAVFARVSAAHKLRIVDALQSAGEVVAMTGDGVNDAPAIKGADVGIAMGRSGTEVTKEASDIVITDDRFATIVDAIEQGRGVDANVRKTLLYLLAGNFGELVFVTICVVGGSPMPLAPIQLLWINLVTDGFPALCLAVDPIDDDLMRRPPRASGAPIVDSGFIDAVTRSGLVTAAGALGVYAFASGGWLENGGIEMARAHAFTFLVYVELLRSFGFRSETKRIWQRSLMENSKLLAVVTVGIAVQLIVPHIRPIAEILQMPPMPISHCAALLLVACGATILMELLKRPARKSADANSIDRG